MRCWRRSSKRRLLRIVIKKAKNMLADKQALQVPLET